jgi:predicted Fe-Mo cluster-binding NifX family protein
MNQARIAIPSTYPGGLEAELGAHFGHCDLYTMVDVKEGLITQVSTLPNVPHQQGGCLAAVDHLARNGATVLIAGGIGLRPLMGFNQAGIEVYQGTEASNVDAAVKSLIGGDLQRFTREHTCGGGQQHQHGQGHPH